MLHILTVRWFYFPIFFFIQWQKTLFFTEKDSEKTWIKTDPLLNILERLQARKSWLKTLQKQKLMKEGHNTDRKIEVGRDIGIPASLKSCPKHSQLWDLTRLLRTFHNLVFQEWSSFSLSEEPLHCLTVLSGKKFLFLCFNLFPLLSFCLAPFWESWLHLLNDSLKVLGEQLNVPKSMPSPVWIGSALHVGQALQPRDAWGSPLSFLFYN